MKIYDCHNNNTIFNTDKWVKLDEVEGIIGFLKDKIAYLEKDNVDFANGIIEIVENNRNLRKENERLHNKNEELEKCIDELNKDIDVRDAMLRASFKR